MSAPRPRGRRRAGWLCGLGLAAASLPSCGSPPPEPAALLQQTSTHMNSIRGFHFVLNVQGFTATAVPVRSADGDAHPPDLHARVQLAQNGVLLEVEIIVVGTHVYLKSFTGGWQELTSAQVAQFFDVHALFDPQTGLFSAMARTGQVSLGAQEAVSGHQAWVVKGRLAAAQVHALLTVARSEGDYAATYWIEAPNTLWRAMVGGKLFDPAKEATITFDFSQHDHAVTVTPPPLG
jgi:lipoprotein LprG